MHIKTGDTVVVIAGVKAKDKNKKGKVLRVDTKNERVYVEGVNMRTKHLKPQGQNQPGGIVQQEGSLHASNVLLYCDKCKKGVRVGHKILADGNKVRVCRSCGETLDK